MMQSEKIYQIKLPAPNDHDPHPRLLVNGRGTHAGDCFVALFPDGWHEISLEVTWDIEGPECWYINTPGFEGISPIGLFVKR
jgi:hypothetical protein